MILSDLLGSEVTDAGGARLGRVVDARFRLGGHTQPATAELVGLIVSPRSASSFLGYERAGAARPALIGHLLLALHRGSFLVAWDDIARIERDAVRLREEYQKLPSRLDPALGVG